MYLTETLLHYNTLLLSTLRNWSHLGEFSPRDLWKTQKRSSTYFAFAIKSFKSHINYCVIDNVTITRSSATAERQRVSYTRLFRLTHWSCTSL